MAKPKSKLAQLRIMSFMTQEEVADILGMTAMNYSKIERGVRGLSIKNAMKLKSIFKVDYIEDLLDDPERHVS